MLHSTSSSNIDLFQDILSQVYYRRFLLHTPVYQTSVSKTAPTASSQNASFGTRPGDNNLDANVVMVLSVLLCALICSLGLNSIVRCALRCSSLVPSSESDTHSSTRLANTGIKKKALKTFPIVNYNEGLKLPGLDSECAICLTEFAPNEKVKVLPKCHHGFHIRCIDKWLNSHSSCPTCRNCLIETCQKIVGCQGSSSAPTTSSVETIVSIAPLEPESLICNYRTNI